MIILYYVIYLTPVTPIASHITHGAKTALELQTSPRVVAQCGKNVTLTCDASSSDQINIIKVMWLAANVSYMCPSQDGNPGAGGLCESKAVTLNKHSFTLTLNNMMPVNQGEYICKLHSTSGIEHSKTFVTVQGE